MLDISLVKCLVFIEKTVIFIVKVSTPLSCFVSALYITMLHVENISFNAPVMLQSFLKSLTK